MTTSNTELAAQAREKKLRRRFDSYWLSQYPKAAFLATQERAAAWHAFKAGADAVESKAEPVAYTVAGPVTNWARDFSMYRTQHYVRPVYAAPVQPEKDERKPLSAEQITNCWEHMGRGFDKYTAFARAIERAHGIGSSTEGGSPHE